MNLAKSLLPALAAVCLIGCNNAATPKEQPADATPQKERVLIIPPIKDLNSMHNRVRRPLPYQYQLGQDFFDQLPPEIRVEFTEEAMMEVSGDTTKLHIKGDSCWLEYVTVATIHAKKKDGSIADIPADVNETTDKVKVQ